MNLTGSMTAIVTPFDNGAIDEASFCNLTDWQVSQGTSVIVVAGTTGEAATLSNEEKITLTKLAIDVVGKRALVMTGTGSNNTKASIELAAAVKSAGAHCHLSVTPYYNKPTQEGLYQHFKSIAAAVDLPMILYNVPGRTSINMSAETTLRLAKLANIIATKEACGDLEQIKAITSEKPANFGVLSGEDAQNLAIYQAGGCGHISVTGNVAPDKTAQIWDDFSAGNIDQASAAQNNLQNLHSAMFIESNPTPAKTALALMGKCKAEFRLPLLPMSEAGLKKLKPILRNYELISN